MQDTFFLLLITVPLFVGLILGSAEHNCECGLPERLMNVWKEGLEFTDFAYLLDTTLSDGEKDAVNDLTLVPITTNNREEFGELLDEQINENPLYQLGKFLNDTMPEQPRPVEEPEAQPVAVVFPPIVWKGILLFTGHIAAAGVFIGNFIYPFNYPLAVIAVIYPLFGGTITYLWAGPFVVIQEFIVPIFRKGRDEKKTK